MAKTFMGVVHLGALPAAAGFGGDIEAVIEAALADAGALARGGVDAIMVENFGDAPFHRGTRDDPVTPDVPAALATIAREVRRATGLPIGINCLRNDAIAALGAAAVAGADYVRVNVLAGAYVTDQGLIQGEAARVVAYRKQLESRVAILADHLVKHAEPVTPVDAATSARDLAERSGASALILSGSRTGEPVDLQFVRHIRDAIGGFPLWIGSGVDGHNAADLWAACDGVIIGTSLKRDGRVDERRVADLRARMP